MIPILKRDHVTLPRPFSQKAVETGLNLSIWADSQPTDQGQEEGATQT